MKKAKGKITDFLFGKKKNKHPKVLVIPTGSSSYIYARKWPRKWQGNCWKIMKVSNGEKVKIIFVGTEPNYENIFDLLG